MAANSQAPLQGPHEQPVPDPLVFPAFDHAYDLPDALTHDVVIHCWNRVQAIVVGFWK